MFCVLGPHWGDLDLPFVDLDAGRIHYRFDGPPEGPVIVFSNSLGTNLSMWDPQVLSLSRKFRVLRYDARGQGLSTTAPGPYTIEGLARDVIQLLDRMAIKRANFCGISMGGMIGVWLGIHAAEHFDRVVLCNTGARLGSTEMWNGRIAMVKTGGTSSIAAASVGRWFTEAFIASAPAAVEAARQMLLQSPADGFIACCDAIRDADFTTEVSQVKVPALVISGSHDVAATPTQGRFLAENIKGARYVELNAAHLSNIETAQEFSNSLLEFLQ
jgi:3-oxoadipate enol-lactonase